MKRLLFSSGQPDRSVPAGYVEIIYSPESGGFAVKHPDGSLDSLGVSIEGTPVHAVAATATLDPTGTDNSVVLTRDEAGAASSLSAEITTPEQAEISVDFDGTTVSISAGTKYRMTISGPLDPDINGTLVYAGAVAGDNGSLHIWSSTGTIEPEDADPFIRLTGGTTTEGDFCSLERYASGIWDAQWNSTTAAVFPDGLTFEALNEESGTPAITASPPTAQQVVAAVNASEIPFTASGAGAGAVAAATAAFSGGSNATVAIKGTEMFDSTNKYTAISDVIASSTSGWRKVAHSAL